MASLYTRRNSKFIWLKWYDKNIHQFCYASTKFENTTAGMKKAKEFKKEFESELNIKNRRTQTGISGSISLGDAFSHYLRNNVNKSSKTIYEYNNWFEKFKKHFSSEMSTKKLNKLDVESFLNKVKTFKMQQNSKQNICKNTKKFLSFLFEYNYTSPFVINKDVLTKPEIKEKIIFTENDYKLIFEKLPLKRSNFRTMVYLLAYSGLRPSDILNITVDRIDLKEETFSFYSQKTKKYKILPIHSILFPILIDRINEIGSGKLLEYSSIDMMGKAMRRYFEFLKLDHKKYNLRTFRKTFDSFGYENGIEPMSAAALLGHSAVIAQKHYREISIKRMKNELEKFQIFPKAVTLAVTFEGKIVNSDK